MKVFIVTEGSAIVGLGHISRCISLYQAFEEKEIYPCLIVNGDNSVFQFLENRNFLLLDWVNNEPLFLEKIMGSDIAVIDSYVADTSICEKITKNVKVVGFIDDGVRINYPSGIVINGSVNTKNLNYPINPKIDFLLGAQYLMLKREFWNNPKKELKKKIKKIIITLGGSDCRNLTPIILKMMNMEFPNLIKKIIIGNGFNNIDEIKNTQDEFSELIYSPSTTEMKKEMMDSDISITAGGQAVYELASVGVPAITVAVAENQLNSVKICDKLGINFYAGWWSDKKLLNNIKNLISNLKDQKLRRLLMEKGQKLIKPDGSRRIIEYLIKKYNNN